MGGVAAIVPLICSSHTITCYSQEEKEQMKKSGWGRHCSFTLMGRSLLTGGSAAGERTSEEGVVGEAREDQGWVCDTLIGECCVEECTLWRCVLCGGMYCVEV